MSPHNLTRLAVSCRTHTARVTLRNPYRSVLPTPTHTPSAAPCVAVLVCALCGCGIGYVLLACLRFV